MKSNTRFLYFLFFCQLLILSSLLAIVSADVITADYSQYFLTGSYRSSDGTVTVFPGYSIEEKFLFPPNAAAYWNLCVACHNVAGTLQITYHAHQNGFWWVVDSVSCL